MKLQQLFQLLELVPLPLAKNWQKEHSESTVASKTHLQLPLSMMSKLALARVLLQARLINYLTTKLLWVLKQDSKHYTHHEKNSYESRPSDSQFECKYFSKDSKVKYSQM